MLVICRKAKTLLNFHGKRKYSACTAELQRRMGLLTGSHSKTRALSGSGCAPSSYADSLMICSGRSRKPRQLGASGLLLDYYVIEQSNVNVCGTHRSSLALWLLRKFKHIMIRIPGQGRTTHKVFRQNGTAAETGWHADPTLRSDRMTA